MKFLKVFCVLVLICMICVTTFAGLDSSVWQGFKYVVASPWGIATLADTYFGFYFCYLWIFYKEKFIFSRIIWFILVTTLGTIAISLYLLIELWCLPKEASVESILLRRKV